MLGLRDGGRGVRKNGEDGALGADMALRDEGRRESGIRGRGTERERH